MYGGRLALPLVAAVSSALGVAAALPAEGALVARYNFEGNAEDATANDRDLTASGGPGYTSGVVGQAASLDGTDDYFFRASEAAFNFGAGDFAISLFYRADPTETFANLVGKTDSNTDVGYAVRLDNGNLQVILRDSGLNLATVARPAGDTTSFQHVVAQRAGDVLQLYLNGTLVSSDTGNDLIDVSSTFPFQVGARNGVAGNPFFGLIDDVRVFDAALSQAEITALSQVPEPAALGLIGLACLGGLRRRRRA